MTPDALMAKLLRIALLLLGDLWRTTPVTDEEWDKLKEAWDELYWNERYYANSPRALVKGGTDGIQKDGDTGL